MRRLTPFLIGLAACGPDNSVTIDARINPALDARVDGAQVVDANLVDTPQAIDAPLPIDGALPCQREQLTFTMDGVLDPSATVIAGGVSSIRIAAAYSTDGRLYVATDDAGEGSDHFVIITIREPVPPAGNRPAPFAKAGRVIGAVGRVMFLADENDNDFSSWFELAEVNGDMQRTGAAYLTATGTNGGVVEGSIDVAAAWGGIPASVWLSAAPYATGDGGALVTAAQTPTGDGDGDVDEWVRFPLLCINAAR